MNIKQVAPPRWPSGDFQFVAVLAKEPRDLEKNHSVRFSDGVDDLGEYVEAAIEMPSGRVLVLNRHANHPNPGIEVMADADDDPVEAMRELQSVLGVSDDDVAWVRQ